jgi:hypothetical protein
MEITKAPVVKIVSPPYLAYVTKGGYVAVHVGLRLIAEVPKDSGYRQEWDTDAEMIFSDETKVKFMELTGISDLLFEAYRQRVVEIRAERCPRTLTCN